MIPVLIAFVVMGLLVGAFVSLMASGEWVLVIALAPALLLLALVLEDGSRDYVRNG